jgi:hypothetical protein
MAAFVKYQNFVEDLGNAVHDLVGTQHTLKVALTNTAPNVATHTVLADITEIAAGNGYSAGGADTQNDGSESGGTVTGVDVTFTASGGAIANFRYVVLYNDTPASPADPLIGYWDAGTTITLNSGDSFTVNFGASMFTVA